MSRRRTNTKAITVTFQERCLWYVQDVDGTHEAVELRPGQKLSGVPWAHVVRLRESFDLRLADGRVLKSVPYDLVLID